jgi:uncharacterized membrane protein (UPF0136 family)
MRITPRWYGFLESMNAQVKLAALFLLLATGPLAEVLSQNVPLLTFLQPVPFLLVTLSYGVPVLLIREVVVARQLNDVAVVLLGLAYGILNEGIVAKTLTQPDGAPLEAFAGYGQLGALQGGWAFFILFWHSLHSVLYPILLSRWLFPAAADRRWFASGRARWLLYVLVVALIGLCSLYFLNPVRSDVGIFLFYVVTILGLAGIALRFCKARETAPISLPAKTSLKPALLGGCMLFFYVFQFWSPTHVPFALFFAASIGIIGFSVASIVRARWRPLPEVLLFGLGDYLTFSSFSALLCVVTGRNPLQAAAAGAMFVALFLYLIRAVRTQPLPPGRKGVW